MVATVIVIVGLVVLSEVVSGGDDGQDNEGYETQTAEPQRPPVSIL